MNQDRSASPDSTMHHNLTDGYLHSMVVLALCPSYTRLANAGSSCLGLACIAVNGRPHVRPRAYERQSSRRYSGKPCPMRRRNGHNPQNRRWNLA